MPSSPSRGCEPRRRLLHFAQDSDTSGYFPKLVTSLSPERLDVSFGTLGPLDPSLRRVMERHGIRCFDFGCRSRWSYPRALLGLAASLRRHRIDILHTHLFDPSVVGLASGVLARTPARVVTRHYSDYHTRINKPLHVSLDRLCTRLSHKVIAVSRHTADHLLTVEKAPPRKVETIPYGIDFDRLRLSSPEAPQQLRSELGLTSKRVLLIAARLHPEKGYETLFRALPSVADRIDGVQLLIAGTGPLETHYRALAAASGLESRVRFLGFRRDLPDLMAAADVFVLPSLAEAFGFVAAESLYLGTPVVASSAGGLPEIVHDGVDGLLVPPGESGALAEALVRILSDKDLARRLSGAGRDRIAARYRFERMVAEYERVYNDLATA